MELIPDVWGGITEEPAQAVGAHGDRRLRARARPCRRVARHPAYGAIAVPLGESPPGCRSQKNDSHGSNAKAGPVRGRPWHVRIAAAAASDVFSGGRRTRGRSSSPPRLRTPALG